MQVFSCMRSKTEPSLGAQDIMLATAPLQVAPSGGRALLSRLIHDCVVGLFAQRLVVLELHPQRAGGFKTLTNIWNGYINGLDSAVIHAVLLAIRQRGIRKVIVDGSNLGALVAAIKSRCPGVEVSTFFHNCEARFFWGALREHRTLRSLGVLFANYLAERRAVRYSDKLICLSERDSSLLRRL